MTTTTNTTPEIKMVSKIVAKTLGNPKKAAALDDDSNVKHVTLGRIFGMADGVKQKEDPISGRIFFGITGRFQAYTADGTIIRSGMLYLPSGIQDSYESAVRNLDEGAFLQFAIELRSVKSSNAAGYTYEAVDLLPRTTADPLDQFAEAVQNPQKQLEAPTEVEPVETQHEAPKAKKR